MHRYLLSDSGLLFFFMTHSYLISATPSLSVTAEEGVITIPFSAVAAYHGHGALAMLAIMYQGLRGALPLLETEGQPVARKNITIISGHPGPGVRDAFEFVTRAVTRGVYTVDTELPFSRFSRGADRAYGFIAQHGAIQVTAKLKADVLPDQFFALLGNPDPEAMRAHSALRHQIAEAVLAKNSEDIFEFVVSAC